MAEKKRSSFILLLEHIHTMEELTDEEFGQFVRAYAAYVETGADPEFSDRSMRMMWKTVKAFDKMNTQKYSSTSEARSEAGKRGMKSRWGAKSEDSKEKKVITNDNKIANVILLITKITYLYLILYLILYSLYHLSVV